jgi:putative ABC transport system ATP-binding protein
MSDAVIRMEDVHKDYVLDGVRVHALRGVNLRVERSDFVAIMGPSGSGKSTLMNIIGCLDVPDRGGFWLNGQDVTRMSSDELARLRNRALGFVFQNFNLLPRTSAAENVETPLIYCGVSKPQRRARAHALLERVGLRDRMEHVPSQLSGGQQQRVALARALINQPALLLADEPTGNLDSATSHEILELLTELNRNEGLTIVMITHEPDVAGRTKRQLIVRDGVIES